jgi:ABC-2 type transport system permease protein
MNLNNIWAILKNDARIVRKVRWRMLEVTYFPLSTLLIWGLFALYSRQYALEAGLIVLVSNLFWSFSQMAQQQANMLMMEDLWTLSIRHVFVAGVTEFEYIVAKLMGSAAVAVCVSSVLLVIANAFGAPLAENLPVVLALAGCALLGSLALSTIIAGTVMMLGREYSFLSWSSLHIFILLSGPFYSTEVFPAAIRAVSEVMPFTYVFSGARALATGAPVTGELLTHAFLVAAAYFVLAWPYFAWAFRRARRTGTLAKVAH